jgi:hypothetical protein
MIPLAIPAIASVASTALETWGKVAEANANARAQSVSKVQNSADFDVMMQRVKAAGTNLQNALNAAPTPDEIQKQVAALPEVKAMLNADFPGTQVNVAVSGKNELTRILPSGIKMGITLSPESQAVINQLAASSGGSIPSLLNLTA